MDSDSTGSATRYDLVPFTKFSLGHAYLKRITFIFYPNSEAMLQAFDAHKLDSIAGVLPADLGKLGRSDFNLVHVPLPRVFGIFFNQSRAPVLAEAAVRAALDAAIDKQQIVDSVLGGYGQVLEGPIPPGAMGETEPATPAPFSKPSGQNATTSSDTSRADASRALLKNAGWIFDEAGGVWKKKKVELSLALATADEPELVATVNAIADAWRAAGVKVTVHVYSLSELNSAVLRPRAYDAVLFGEVVGRTTDLFAFWHSSQRNDPGLNLALYANSRADSLLTQARATTDQKQRKQLYAQFSELIGKDNPAIFLYAPEFIYLVPASIHGVALGALTSASERFLNIHEWYTDTEQVWNIFTDKSN